MAAQNVVAGPWGGQGGNAWSFLPKGVTCGIVMTYGDVINTIRFTSQDEFGNLEHSPQFGSHVGSNKAEIDIDPKVEKLNGITGTFGSHGNLLVVTSLSFTTDKEKSYGPFGSANGTAFSLVVNNQIISGFHGRSGSFLDAIGVYLQPIPKLSIGPWGGQGGNAWSYVPKGAICRISMTYGDVIDTIRFTSQDEFGNLEHSPQFGNHVGSNNAEIDIDPKVVKLNGISGTFGSHGNLQVVTSLSFTTDKEKSYGPFGSANGTAFSLVVNNQTISGFHGRSGSFLDAIGIYLQPIPKLSIGPWGGQGGNAWSYVPKGAICRISMTYGDVINTIRFTSQDEFGNLEHSPQFGSHLGSNKAEIDIDPKVVKLNGILGTFGSHGNLQVVTSLSFTTDKKIYGPFGSAKRTTFSLVVNDQTISGFHGRSGSFLDAIGIYL